LEHAFKDSLLIGGKETEMAAKLQGRNSLRPIRILSADPAKCKQLGQAARSTVRERFMIEENAKRVEQHLQRAILTMPENFGNIDD